jgi:hypothetical protein
MGLITGIVTAPLWPLRAVVWVAEQIQEEAERQWSDPATIQRELAEVEHLRETGVIDEAEAEAREDALLERLFASQAEPGLDLEGGDWQ